MTEQQCRRPSCQYVWKSRTANPKECPACKSRSWNAEPGEVPKKPRLNGRQVFDESPETTATWDGPAKQASRVSGELPATLPELPDFEGILGSKNVAVNHQGSTPSSEEIPPSVEELAANPPFTALEGEK